MEEKGRLISVSKNYKNSKFLLTFEVDGDVSRELDEIEGKDLRIRAVKWKEKRSLDANAYCWVLLGKIAQKLNTTADEIYELALRDLGIADLFDGEELTITISANVPIEEVPGHWKFTGDTGNGCKRWLKLKGSSEYDTAEMSMLIDMIVSEAKDLGIETRTPDELERMKQLWQGNVS